MTADETYRRFFPLVRHHCRRLVGDEGLASDLAQETFIRLLKSRELSGGEQGTVRWLYRTSSNLAIDHLRARKRSLADELSPMTQSPDATAELRSVIRRLATLVSAEALQAALLSRANGLTQPELAQVLEVSERTVRRWLSQFDDAVKTLAVEQTP
jgi:RNA polymerase sigma-70 factor (ECF subfamily)